MFVYETKIITTSRILMAFFLIQLTLALVNIFTVHHVSWFFVILLPFIFPFVIGVILFVGFFSLFIIDVFCGIVDEYICKIRNRK